MWRARATSSLEAQTDPHTMPTWIARGSDNIRVNSASVERLLAAWGPGSAGMGLFVNA